MDKMTQEDRIKHYAHLIQRQTGKAVRPYRADGYVNMVNRYGTSKDSSEQYNFVPDAPVADDVLEMHYENNGLFSKIIDMPAEEAIKHGFTIEDVEDGKLADFYSEALDELNWEENAMTAVKWARLFGGSIAIMLVNDGRGLEEPLDWKNIQSIDDIRVYDRSLISPDYSSVFNYDPQDPFRVRGSRLGMPEYYDVYSKYGSFRVHDSRCLVFQNGVLPENATNSIYQFWGIPEYIRLNKAIRDADIAHRSAPKLLERSVQPIYKMKDLAAELATEQGEDRILKRLQVIDTARGILNSLVIDADGEDYDFKTFQYNGITDVISASCNMLAALSNIPQIILFGQTISGMSSTDDTSMENYYNYVERIQKRMLRSNLRYLLSVVFQAGLATGEVDEVPKLKVQFNPLWSVSDSDQATLDQQKAQTEQIKAQTAQIYVGMEAIDPSEVRSKLADSDDFDVENMLDEYTEEELEAGMPSNDESQEQTPDDGQPATPDSQPTGNDEKAGPGQLLNEKTLSAVGNNAKDPATMETKVSSDPHENKEGTEGDAPASAPAATKKPSDMDPEEKAKAAQSRQNKAKDREDSLRTDDNNSHSEDQKGSVGVIVVNGGRVLNGTRHNDFGYGLVCGPGGHIEEGETPEQAAFRETKEEFGITPKSLMCLGQGPKEKDTGLKPYLFLCTEYYGTPNCEDLEMTGAKFSTIEELNEKAESLFGPFADGLNILMDCLETGIFYTDPAEGVTDEKLNAHLEKAMNSDGGPGSGNYGHEGVPGQVGGSAPSTSGPISKSSFQNGSGHFEVTGDVKDMYLTKPARTRIEGAIKTVKTANDLKKYLENQGIKLETSYEPLKKAMDREIPSIKEQADYVIAAIEQYKDLGGLKALKAVHIYDHDIDAQAQYSYRAKGEGEVPDEGHLYISYMADGAQIMHEFAHAYADSTKPDGMDVVEWSAKLNQEAGLSKDVKAYFGADSDAKEAERFANAMGYAIADGDGPDGRLAFAANVANIVRNSNGSSAGMSGGNIAFRSMIPKDSYFNSPSYKKAVEAYRGAIRKHDDAWKKYSDLKEDLKAESAPKPESEWDDNDIFEDLIGHRPMTYTEKGKKIKSEMDKAFKDSQEYDHEQTETGDKLREIKKKEHDKQVKNIHFQPPADASSDDYEGFTTKTTGTSAYDDYINGERNGGRIAEMSPAEYLQRCAYQVFEDATIESTLAAIDESNVKKYADMMKNGTKFDMPYLNFMSGQQEGRHRAAAAMQAGIDKIPVLVVGERFAKYDGGKGSGNWGHEGRKGKLGGSAPGGGVHNRISEEGGSYTSFSKKQKKLATTHFAGKGEFHNLPDKTKIVADLVFGPYSMVYNAKHGMFIGEDGAEMNPDDVTDACDKDTPVRVFIPNEASTNYNKLKQSFDVSPSRMAEAKAYSQPKQADKDLRKKTGEVWKTLTDGQKKSLYDYTGGFFMDINHSLRSGHGTVQNQSKASDITTAIAKSKTQEDMWLYRGVGLEAVPKMFGIDWGKIQKNDIGSIVGMSGSDDGFMSCGTTAGTGYGDVTDVNMKIFVPKGSEALYAEPFSKYGSNPDAKNWNGESDQTYFSSEMETILQRGSHFQCTKAYYDEDKKKYSIEVAVTGQEYKELNW